MCNYFLTVDLLILSSLWKKRNFLKVAGSFAMLFLSLFFLTPHGVVVGSVPWNYYRTGYSEHQGL